MVRGGGRRRRPWLVVVPVAVLVLLTGARCGGADEVSAWDSEAARFLGSGADTPALHVGSDSESGDLRKLLGDAPKDPTSTESDLLRQLNQRQAFDQAAEDVYASDRTAWDAIPDDTDSAARDSLLSTISRDAFDKIVEKGTDLLKETACDAAWQMTTPSEKQDGNGLVNQGYTLTAPPTMSGMVVTVEQSAVGAIQSALRDSLIGQVVPEDALAWFNYAQDIYDKASELTSDGGELVLGGPGGVVSTYAMVFYVKLCMAPPGTE